MSDPLVETREIHDRINAYLVGALPAPALPGVVVRSLGDGGKVKGSKPHVHALVGYLVSHESHHRGQIALALEQSGMALDKKIAYGLWEWGSR